MSPGLVLVVVVALFLLGGWSGRFGGYGYGLGHAGMGFGGVVFAILIILLLLEKI